MLTNVGDNSVPGTLGSSRRARSRATPIPALTVEVVVADLDRYTAMHEQLKGEIMEIDAQLSMRSAGTEPPGEYHAWRRQAAAAKTYRQRDARILKMLLLQARAQVSPTRAQAIATGVSPVANAYDLVGLCRSLLRTRELLVVQIEKLRASTEPTEDTEDLVECLRDNLVDLREWAEQTSSAAYAKEDR